MFACLTPEEGLPGGLSDGAGGAAQGSGTGALQTGQDGGAGVRVPDGSPVLVRRGRLGGCASHPACRTARDAEKCWLLRAGSVFSLI